MKNIILLSNQDLQTVQAYVEQFIEDMGNEFTLEQGAEWFEDIGEDADLIAEIKSQCLSQYERHQIGAFVSFYKE